MADTLGALDPGGAQETTSQRDLATSRDPATGKLTTDQVLAILRAEKSDSIGVTATLFAEERRMALAFYRGDMRVDMPHIDGRSEAVSSDVQDTVEGMMPVLMDIFASGEEVVRFDAVNPDDEQAAAQETDYVNHVFMQKNPGFLILYSFIKDCLLSKIGVVKIWWEEYEREERETYENQDEMGMQALVSQDDSEVECIEEGFDPVTKQKTYDVTLVTKGTYGRAKCEAVPPEEFGIKKNARNLECATYIYHQPAGITVADLIAQGYDKDQVMSLPAKMQERNRETMARDESQGFPSPFVADLDKSAREVLITEHYKVMDYEQNSKLKLYRITTGGSDNNNDEIPLPDRKPRHCEKNEKPVSGSTPIINTQRFFGRSLADLVLDVQKIKTALLRGALDGVYLANNQRIGVATESAHERTIDDLLVNRPGGVVRMRRPDCLVPIPNNPIGPFVMPMIEYMDQLREQRTGVTRQGQGIGPDVLQNQTAAAVTQMFSMAQARMKLIARVIAETGVRRLFSLLHTVIRKNEDRTNTVRLRNQWVEVNPRDWKERDDMTINVGLGTGTRDQQISQMMMLLGLQKEAIQAPQLGLVDGSKIYNSVSRLGPL